jgi:branched-chain amino acid transport system ATP-binding protein
MTLLLVEKLNAFYGDLQVLYNIFMEIDNREVVALVGPNGAGKTTLCCSIIGTVKRRGRIMFENTPIDHMTPDEVIRRGIALVPEGRRLFGNLTVLENLEVATYTLPKEVKKKINDTLDFVFTLFPRLKERKNQLARTLSGGEQQMLAIARALMARPKLLLLDEPSLGLAPKVVQQLYDALRELFNSAFVKSILLVEQYVNYALSLAHKAYLLVDGQIKANCKVDECLKSETFKKLYLGLT